MNSHREYSHFVLDPLIVGALFHCGEIRDICSKKGIDTTTRWYRIDRKDRGRLIAVRNHKDGSWNVQSTFGEDYDGSPLICTADLVESLTGVDSWHEAEVRIATYFSCGIYQHSATSFGRRKIKVEPRLDRD